LLACALAGLASIASAQVYECTSAAGTKEFAQFCAPGTVQQRQVNKGSEGEAGRENPQGAGGKSIELQGAEFKQRMLERQDAEATAAETEARAEEFKRNCEEARSQLQVAESGQRMTRFDPATGERIQFGDTERADEVERQRKAISLWCK
jgi:hypothetical protein